MRVLIVTGSFPPMTCGVGDYTMGLARALSDQPGVHVAVLTGERALAAPGDRYALFPAMRDWNRAEFARVKDVLRSWKPEVVHIQFPTQGYCGPLAWRLPLLLQMHKVPVVQTWHEYFPRLPSVVAQARATWRELPLALSRGDVIVVRPEYARHMPWWYRLLIAHKRLHLIPNASSIPRVVLDDELRAVIRRRYAADGKKVLVFFGFCYQHKGIDDALELMNPERHHLVIAGGIDESDPYQVELAARIRIPPLVGHVTMTGFLPPLEAAQVLAAADAVVLPFREGGGPWNTTIKAAALQGTFVLTTSAEKHGLDAGSNVYYARPRDRGDLSQALDAYIGRRAATPSPESCGPTWREIAERHVEVYRRHVRPAPRGSAG